MGVEGEVLLEVLFASDGRVQVLRLVRGLGHGLDESAVRAAEKIRFSPAQREGQAVDISAIVHIVFSCRERLRFTMMPAQPRESGAQFPVFFSRWSYRELRAGSPILSGINCNCIARVCSVFCFACDRRLSEAS